ncbi:MAG TPA: hypothetical protein VFA18_15500 [Gemmataceae bacterium]|nr:hypothetical protein [Gemmataceae bacterium]
MQGAAWTNILRLIPVDQHAKLVLITHNNTEIHLQGILHQDRDHMIVRGRLAASTDAGRVFFIPFDQVHYLAFRDPMKESDVLALLGLDGTPAPPPAAAAPETAVEDSAPESASQTPANQGVGANSGQFAKAALLERLRRARGQDKGGPKTVTP